MSEQIPHSRPTLGDDEANAAAEAVRSRRVAAGERTARLEQALAEYVGVRGAVATSSGTAALLVALRAVGVGPGDEVLVPSYVCTALLHAVWAAGAEPVVCDVGADYNLSPASARDSLSARTKAIIVAHLFGRPAAIEEFLAMGPPVIEDCAQSVGAEIGGARCGSLGAVSIFSFYATKLLTTGEGGMLASKSAETLAAARDFIEYDKKPDAVRRFNLKFNDIGAAVGLAQLSRLPAFIQRRREVAARYDREFTAVPGIRLPSAPGSVYYRYVIETDDPVDLIRALRSRGIEAARPVDPPLHRVTGTGDCPNADRAWGRAVSLPIYPSLTDPEARRIVSAVLEHAAGRR